jgi:hypothetical protein
VSRNRWRAPIAVLVCCCLAFAVAAGAGASAGQAGGARLFLPLTLRDSSPNTSPRATATPSPTPLPASTIDVGRTLFVTVDWRRGTGQLWLAGSGAGADLAVGGGLDPHAVPVVSPRGDAVAVRRYGDPTSRSGPYWAVYDLTGKLQAVVERAEDRAIETIEGDTGASRIRDVSWTADSTTLIYSDSFVGIYSFDVLTRQSTPLVQTNWRRVLDHSASMSPDGRTLLFAHHEFGGRYYVSLVKIEPSKLPYRGEDRYNSETNPSFHLLASGVSDYNQHIPSVWAQDSRKVLFFVNGAMFAVDPESLSVLQVRIDRCLLGTDNVALSRDGARVAAGCPGRGLLVMNVDGSNQRYVSTDVRARSARFLAWAGADDEIVFISDRTRFVVDADGANLRAGGALLSAVDERGLLTWASILARLHRATRWPTGRRPRRGPRVRSVRGRRGSGPGRGDGTG